MGDALGQSHHSIAALANTVSPGRGRWGGHHLLVEVLAIRPIDGVSMSTEPEHLVARQVLPMVGKRDTHDRIGAALDNEKRIANPVQVVMPKIEAQVRLEPAPIASYPRSFVCPRGMAPVLDAFDEISKRFAISVVLRKPAPDFFVY